MCTCVFAILPHWPSIAPSAAAAARLNGGARVRAFVLEGMDDARATVDLGENRSLVLDHGLYGLF